MWELENLTWTVEERRKYWERQYGIVLRYGGVICRRIQDATDLEQIFNLYARSSRSLDNEIARIKRQSEFAMVPGSNTRH